MDESNNNIKKYYMELQNKLNDFRDNRGKKHELAFVILSFFLAILRSSGKLNYSIIHRTMKRDYIFLKETICEKPDKTISYSQIKRILSRINYKEFNLINQELFGQEIIKEGLIWHAIDGKELRGTIDKVVGEKRNENIIQQVEHQSKQSKLIEFYNGSKESEKTIVKNFIDNQTHLQGQAFSFDALHTSSGLLENISSKSGVYLVQVKENQKHLLQKIKNSHKNVSEKNYYESTEKAHGRIENREGFLYPLNVDCLDKRWEKTDIHTLIVIERNRYIVKTKVNTTETSYFISNKKLDEKSGLELFNATRQHWSIESDNYIRDVNFGEDGIICFNKNTSRMIAVSISLALNLLRKLDKNSNIKALREDICNDRNLIFSCLAVN